MSVDESVSTLLLSKPDIAALARVQRPVVSMWVARYRTSSSPFPAPVSARGREDLYLGTEVVDWIRSRSLGNSDSLAEDLAVHAALDHRSELDMDVVFHGITALLCVKSMLGGQLADLGRDDLLDEADGLDPDDEFFFSEVDSLGDHIDVFARYVDQMSDAAYTPAQAFESLMAQRFRMQRADLADSALAPRALDLCARVCVALATDAHDVFVDPSVDGSDLLVALRKVLPEFEEPLAMTGKTDSAASRLARRRLAVHEWRRRKAPEEGFGDSFAIDGPAMFLTQFPSPSTVGLSDGEVLGSIDNIVLQMGPQHRGVVIGPATALVDPIRDREARLLRADLLRSDRVRAVVRLPEGLLTTRPGLSMALWVLGAADPSIKAADRWTVLADLSAVELDDGAVEGIVSDVTAAVGTGRSVHAHAFRYGFVARTAVLLADDKRGLTPPARRRKPFRRSGAESAGRALELVDAVNRSAALLDSGLDVKVEYHESGPAPLPTLGALVAAKDVKVLPGNRVDDSDVVDDGGVRVLGSDEVLGRRRIGDRGIDRLAFTTKYPSGRYTEPGDIVFCTTPSFGAVVDHEGSSVVLAPARVLRVKDLTHSGLVPELIAGHLMATVSKAKPTQAIRSGNDWKGWEVPRIAPEQVASVGATFHEIRERHRAATEVLINLDNLATTLVDGLAHGVLTVVNSFANNPEKG